MTPDEALMYAGLEDLYRMRIACNKVEAAIRKGAADPTADLSERSRSECVSVLNDILKTIADHAAALGLK